MNNNRTGDTFFSGFLLGAFIGAAVVFLLGTKKGKKLLKVISEEGLDGVSGLLEKIDNTVDLDEATKGEKEDEMLDKEVASAETIEAKPRLRRFFKGIPRRLN